MSKADLLSRYTYEEYAKWKGDWELIEGFPVSMAPSPMKTHQNIVRSMLIELTLSFEEQECEECEIFHEMDWKINNNTVLRPDIIFVCGDENEKYITKAPKIVIEVLSPSTAKKDETVKFEIYEEERVEYYILVYPEGLTAKVYKLKEDNYQKVGDFTKETLDFRDIECELKIDFSKVFKRYK